MIRSLFKANGSYFFFISFLLDVNFWMEREQSKFIGSAFVVT